ncbi:MAG: YihY/virulence factor BrkB family protein [Alphaproteobacteria bacterium]
MPKKIIKGIWKAAVNTVNHDGIEHAGYLAFLGLLAMFPFLVFVFSIVGLAGQGETGAAFIKTLLQSLPYSVSSALEPRINEIISGPPQGLLTISILGAIWTASSAVEGLRTVLNRAYHVGTPPAYWFRRSLSVLQLFIFTSILIGGMILLLAVPFVLDYLQSFTKLRITPNDEASLHNMFMLLSIGFIFLSVCCIYYLIPNIKQSLLAVVPGAIIVVGLWIFAAGLFASYLANFDQVNLIYGSLGGIIAALLFFYICNIIFIFGAELNYQIVQIRGERVIQREAAPAPAEDITA